MALFVTCLAHCANLKVDNVSASENAEGLIFAIKKVLELPL